MAKSQHLSNTCIKLKFQKPNSRLGGDSGNGLPAPKLALPLPEYNHCLNRLWDHALQFSYLHIKAPTFDSRQKQGPHSPGVIRREYGMGCDFSTYGDVYNYGILLLEMFIGKRPTDDMFNSGVNLHNFAKMAIPERVMEISDPTLLHTEDKDTSKSFQTCTKSKYEIIEDCLISTFRVGIACSMELPRQRMAISSATTELLSIRHSTWNWDETRGRRKVNPRGMTGVHIGSYTPQLLLLGLSHALL
ncbi:unnamed protein product [Ilex paraguariensis]|uniref:Serine-threonine/tyrosine-protein kinase catalytic domain-containing protein n=1 Tax=Ilex paraguariensis TaxID=185542 RepID=A0ABC8UPC0_9AQUA